MSDYDEIVMQRVCEVRDMFEIDFTETVDGAVPIGAEFIRGPLRILVLPTIGDELLAVDVLTFRGGELESEQMIVVGE